MKYCLDTTALAIHVFEEDGAETVQHLLSDLENDICVSALSLLELGMLLKKQGAAAKVPTYWETYEEMFDIVAVDMQIVQASWKLREQIKTRLPLSQAIVAATAQIHGATLVHNDPLLSQLPTRSISQLRLGK
ncbi:MAG: PIN domain-containing protein [Chthoniobacterales bacterium]|nr:PIN domain-containing protein [Chthoniobacterales bacterium]